MGTSDTSPPGQGLRTRALVQALPLGVLVLRLEPGARLVVAASNPAADRVLGACCEGLWGKTLEEAFPLLASSGLAARCRSAASEGTSWQGELARCEGGRPVSAWEVSVFPVEPGEVACLLADAPGRQKPGPEEQQELERRCRRLETLGLVAAGLGHDLNNLLGGLFSYMELARESSEEPRVVREHLGNAAAMLGRARCLTGQLLGFAKGGTSVRTRVDLGALLREAFAAPAGAEAPLRLEIAPDLAAVQGSPGELRTALEDLLVVSRQAGPGAAPQAVRARNVPESVRLPEMLSRRRHVEISVGSVAAPAFPEDRQHVVEPGSAASRPGDGLGLALAQSIARKHDGVVTMDPAEGAVGTFHLWLPTCEAAAEARPAEVRPRRRRFEGLKALVVDDESYVRDVAAAMLRRMGCEVAVAGEGAEALELVKKARAEGRRFDALLLDLTLPGGMGGEQVLQAVKALDPASVAVASSGYSEDPIIATPKEHGFAASIRKPFIMDELASAIESAIASAKPRQG